MINVILLSLAVGFFIIGVHQTMTVGVMFAYPILMLACFLLLAYMFKVRMDDKHKKNSKKSNLKKR